MVRRDQGLRAGQAEKIMSPDPIYCPALTYRQTRDTPAEYCETEVADYGDLCDRHDEDDRADADYENYQESLRDDA